LLLLFGAIMSESVITLQQVRHVAELGRLELDDAELETMRAQLDAVLGYMAKLKELEVSGVEPTFYSIEMEAPLRPDRVKPSLPREEAMRAAPAEKEGGFAVPRVIEG
jgi:aspartyl-tRNA(Asn)/glutamyl-tRNA(Gln) amidotransferase subunit C